MKKKMTIDCEEREQNRRDRQADVPQDETADDGRDRVQARGDGKALDRSDQEPGNGQQRPERQCERHGLRRISIGPKLTAAR
jgi:hypothetical protein